MKIRLLVPATLFVTGLFFSCAGLPQPDQTEPESQPDTELSMEETTVPNLKWFPSKEISMYVDGTVDKVTEYTYDELARPLTEIENDSRGELIVQRNWTYNSLGPVSLEIFDRTGLISTTRYTLDGEGRVIRETTMDPNGKVQSELLYNYEGGNLVSSEARDASGSPQLILEYSYDEDIVTLIEYKRVDGTLEARFERKLDGRKIVEEKTVLPDDTVESAVKFSYDGNLPESGTYYIGTTKTKSADYETDENGNIVRETWLNANARPFEVIERSWVSFQQLDK